MSLTIPIPLSGERQSRLDALLRRGDPDLFVIDDRIGGQHVYVLIATGAAREWIQSLVSGQPVEEDKTIEDPDLHALWRQPKPVSITEGPHSAEPGARRPS